ncbi:hypothetical protein UNDKW_5957 (plasmid) [Undibacterium sp. KW1]|uniref:hypothetical protein n=1 Tax=Undibacterium sp. KW1 TaxID=2058624 RepID=UPI001331E110|nr:hypothetical protein [Undibacterium sp. KW1]BBB64230.1 hypothetical protein UNDKW_5957 [Undibacterium sp. KW1]
MDENKSVLRVKFDICYQGERVSIERIDQLKEKILTAGIDEMLASKLESEALSYSMDIQHVGPSGYRSPVLNAEQLKEDVSNFVGSILNDFKLGAIDATQVTTAIENVIGAVDEGDCEKAVHWLRAGRKLIRQ